MIEESQMSFYILHGNKGLSIIINFLKICSQKLGYWIELAYIKQYFYFNRIGYYFRYYVQQKSLFYNTNGN